MLKPAGVQSTLDYRMQIDIKFLVICKCRINTCKQIVHFLSKSLGLDVLVVRTSPCRHVRDSTDLVITASVFDFCSFRLVAEYRIARIAMCNDFARKQLVQVVVAHNGFACKVIREKQMARLQEVVLCVVHRLNAALHLLAESFPRSTVPGLQIDLLFSSDEVRRERAVVDKESCGRKKSGILI